MPLRARRVRIHQLQGPTVEGIQRGRRRVGGHYVVLTPSLLETADDGEIRKVPLDAAFGEIPAEKVILVEVMAS